MSGPSFVNFLYEDEHLLVVDKPAKLAVHPSEMCRDQRTLLSLTRNKLGGQYVYPVHRLDKPVSGPVLFAKSSEMCGVLQKQFAEGRVDKQYIALVRGWAEPSGEVDSPLKKENGTVQECLTRYERLAKAELNEPFGIHKTVRYSLLRLIPVTGRFHQLRRHLRDISRPILGDTTDGDSHQNRFFREKFNLKRLMLHSFYLGFTHPITGEYISAYVHPDKDLCSVFEQLGWMNDIDTLKRIDWSNT